jgi:hypothetical protein
MSTTELLDAELGRLRRENRLLGDVLLRAVLLMVPAEARSKAVRDVLAQARSLGIPPIKTADHFRLPLAEASIAYAKQEATNNPTGAASPGKENNA